MKIILNVIFTFSVMNSFSQATFLGFDQPQCGLIENHGYSFTNEQGLCSSHSAVYKIFSNGNLVYEKPCKYLEFYFVDTMFFVNDSTGFIIEKYQSSNHFVYKTEDFGKSWKRIGWGGPTYWDFYVIDEHNVYLITGANGGGPLITRASDTKSKMPADYSDFIFNENEAIINDTISGNIFCGYDTLSFKVKDGADTITFKIALERNQLSNTAIELSVAPLEVYPNPCVDYIYFSENILKSQKVVCCLYSVEGSLVKSAEIVNNKLFVGDLQPGIYLMSINNRNAIITEKIIKQ